ncbi:MAG: glycoside hydrolase family 95 protein, partial [Verrucomicrobiales bacterium]
MKPILWLLGLAISTVSTLESSANPANKFRYQESVPLEGLAAPPEQPLSLWYLKPATYWEEALPVGNGRLGAMVYGGLGREMIQLNEESIWAGPPVPEIRGDATKTIAKVRKLLFEGKYVEAQKLQQSIMPARISPRSYQTMGELLLDFDISGEATGYRRDLNLDTAVATTRYSVDGVDFVRKVTVSPIDQVIVVNISASKPGSISFDTRLERLGTFSVEGLDHHSLVARGQADHGEKHKGVKFTTVCKAHARGGSVKVQDTTLTIHAADEVTLYLAALTDYNRHEPAKPLEKDFVAGCVDTIDRAIDKGFAKVCEESTAAHQELFRRVELKLGTPSQQSTLARLQNYTRGETPVSDPNFEALYFQYGRYLLITSSREGNLPANLQGIWCKDLRAPWHSDYHININAQMNYWPAETTNLSECHLPFFDYLERLVPAGKETAQKLYGTRGFLATHASDVWHFSVPFGKVQYGQWVVGGAWCTQHFMEHYRFTGDKAFLRDRAYPILKESALFFLDWLTEDPETGKLVSGPSTSPENKFYVPGSDEDWANLSMGPSMDQQIIWDVFTNTVESAEILGIEDDFIAEVKAALAQLA